MNSSAGRSGAEFLNACEMRSPLVERQAHLLEVVVFTVDAGHSRRSVVEDALGNRIGYTELRGARLPAQMLRFIIAKGQCSSNDSAGRGAAFALPNILL